MTDIVALGLRETATAIRDGSLSAVEVVRATLERIDTTEPVVHAYAFWSPDAALRTAQELDDELRHGTVRGPLHGVPIGVKDSCYTVDMPTEAGSRVLAGFIPDYDATVVGRLRESGAVIVGKTVTHEFTYGQNVPPTRNAWDAECYPGGSSAGSAVAVAVRSAYGAIGTDTGGSIRIPASVNGVVGLKPTFGSVSRHGVIQMSPSLDCAGPLARTADECAVLFDAIAGHDPLDLTSMDFAHASAIDARQIGIEGAVIGVERSYLMAGELDNEVRDAVSRVAETLAAQGAEVVDVDIPELELMPIAAMSILLGDTSAYHRHLLRTRAADYEPGTRRMLELGELIPATHYATAQRVRTLLKEVMRRAFESHRLDALLGPTTPQAAVPITELDVDLVSEDARGVDGVRSVTLASYARNTFPANLTGQPALSVPCGFTASGLPIGFQLLGRPLGEPVLFQIAGCYERAEPWHKKTPIVEFPSPADQRHLQD